ncbi:MAG: sigma-54 interaction domain-containing protein [Planctomycetota bacterium]|jgi:two-component system nitrogen regulation response regulator GlnG
MADTIMLITKDRRIAQKVREACRDLDVILTHEDMLDAAQDLSDALPNLVLCDYDTFNALQEQYPRACVLLYTEPSDSEQAIEAIKRGALDYLVTPIETSILAEHIQEALRISRDVRVPAVYEEPGDDIAVERIIGQSPAMRDVYKLIGRVAPRNVNVLVTGESGTGKELIARAILHHSSREDKPFLAVNCAAIPETLIESELFGHEEGAFTGASLRRIGKFEQCHGGTLFLDEIGDIPIGTQAKLLRVLQDNSFQRLGGTELVTSDVRVIAATHQPLESLIAEKRFRQDLYFRLKVASINVPPLRDREVDVVLLAHEFVRRYNRSLSTDIRTFSPEVLSVLIRYHWPGNVRELENAIKAALVVARGTVLRLEFLPEHIQKGGAEARKNAETQTPPIGLPTEEARAVAENLALQSALDGKLHEAATSMIEREVILVAVKRCEGRLAPAARLLGISRTTLRKRMAQHGIRTSTSVEIESSDEC